jgi:hypothetical protein
MRKSPNNQALAGGEDIGDIGALGGMKDEVGG